MDGTENLNGNLPSLPEILEGTAEKSSIRKLLQACVENEKPTIETETIQRNFGNRQNGNRDNPKKLWNRQKQAGKQQTRKKPEHATQNWRPKLRKARNGNLHKNGNLTLKKTKKLVENGEKTTCSGLTADTEMNEFSI